jgi:hypothetical protein
MIPHIHEIALQLDIIEKNKEKMMIETPNIFSEEEIQCENNNKRYLKKHIQKLLKYINSQNDDADSKKMLRTPLKIFYKLNKI